MDLGTEDQAKMHISTLSYDDDKLFGDVEAPTRAETTSAAANRDVSHVTRSISKRLLDWGVEERGTYCIRC